MYIFQSFHSFSQSPSPSLSFHLSWKNVPRHLTPVRLALSCSGPLLEELTPWVFVWWWIQAGLSATRDGELTQERKAFVQPLLDRIGNGICLHAGGSNALSPSICVSLQTLSSLLPLPAAFLVLGGPLSPRLSVAPARSTFHPQAFDSTPPSTSLASG